MRCRRSNTVIASQPGSPKVYKLEVDLALDDNYNTVSETCQNGDIPLSILMQ
jgi:hypothetical protein